MLVLLLLSATFSLTVESSSVEELTSTPKFTLVDRSLNNVPSIAIIFPDGYEDTLVLDTFESNSGDENRMIGVDNCHYLGHLANEPEACVAVTGCVGSEDVDFTILSAHSTGSSMFKWTKEGHVEVVNQKMIDYTATGNHTFPPLPLPVKHRKGAFVSEDRMQTLGEECDGRSCILPPTMNLKVRVGYLDGYYNYFEGNTEVIENQIAKAWVHVQAWFCHQSLGTKISVERVSTKHYPGFSPAWDDYNQNNDEEYWINQYLQTLSNDIAQEESHPDDRVCTMAFIDYLNINSNIKGLGNLNSACISPGSATINFITHWSAASNGQQIAHELGHNLGMRHDSETRDYQASLGNQWPQLGLISEPYSCNGQDDAVMNAVVTGTKTKWTECSRKDLEFNYVYINSELIDMAPSYLNHHKKEGTLEADPNACNPVNPTTPQPFTGHYETCADKNQNNGACFYYGPNGVGGEDPLQKGGYCQFPSFMADICYNTCGYCTDPPVKVTQTQIPGCRYLNITLKNNALIDLVEYQGIYEQDQYLVYGQPAWKKFDEKYGIWYSSGFSNPTLNVWMVGSWDVVSVYYDNIFDTQSAKRILPYDGNFGYPQEMTKWIYTDGNGAVVNFLLDEGVNQDDVTIQCLGLENAGQDCWDGCNQQEGKCSWCGPEGYCCSKGWTGNGCDGSFGGDNYHACVLKPN